MVAGHVVLVAQDDGDGLVVRALVHQEHGLALGALGALAAAHQVDGAAQDLLRLAHERAVGVDVAAGLLAAMAHDVVEIAHVLAGGQVAGVHVHARQIAAQVGGKARVGLAGAQHAVADGDERALVADDARVVERHPRVVERMHGRDVNVGVLSGEHAQHHAHHAAAGGGGVKRHGQVECSARGGHHVDGGHVGGAVDAGDAHRGLAALTGCRREHGCGALAGGFGQPCGGLLAHAALERLGHVVRHLLAHGLVLVGGQGRDIQVGGVHVGVDGL